MNRDTNPRIDTKSSLLRLKHRSNAASWATGLLSSAAGVVFASPNIVQDRPDVLSKFVGAAFFVGAIAVSAANSRATTAGCNRVMQTTTSNQPDKPFHRKQPNVARLASLTSLALGAELVTMSPNLLEQNPDFLPTTIIGMTAFVAVGIGGILINRTNEHSDIKLVEMRLAGNDASTS